MICMTSSTVVKKMWLHVATQSPKWGHWSLLCPGLTRQQADNHRGTVQNVQKGIHNHFLPVLILAVRMFQCSGCKVDCASRDSNSTCVQYFWYLRLPHESTILGIYIPVLLSCTLVLLSIPVIKYSGSLLTQAAHYFPQQSGSQWPLMSFYPWHWTVTLPWHCFRHGRSCWSWEDSLAPVYTTVSFVQKHGSAMRNL